MLTRRSRMLYNIVHVRFNKINNKYPLTIQVKCGDAECALDNLRSMSSAHCNFYPDAVVQTQSLFFSESEDDY